MELELKEILAPLRKWWWLIVLSTLIAGFSSYLATSRQPELFRSSTTLMIGSAIEDPNPSSADFFTSQRLAGFYVDLANRPSVRTATREALEEQCDCAIRMPDIFVRLLNDTNVIDVVVEDTNGELAQAVAAELTRQLILRSPTAQQDDPQRQAFVNEQLDNYQAAIQEAETQIIAKNEELSDLVSAREIASVQAEIETLESNLQTLRTNFANLLQSTQQGATNTIRVIEPASSPWRVPQNNLVTVMTAAGIGLVLAASAAYILEYLDDTVKTPEHIRRLTGLSTLAGIADITTVANKLITISTPRSPISETFRVLRTAVQFSAVDRSTSDHALLITSSVPKDGKSTITANLSVVMAQAGHNVLLIDADLRRPSQHHIFNLPNKRGLTSLLLELSRLESDEQVLSAVNDIVQTTEVEGLQLLTSGPIPPNPSELLGSSRMKMLLDKLTTLFDFVIFDSPPMLAVTDAAVLSTQVDVTLLVVRANQSRRTHVRQAVERLREVNANLIGTVLNSLPTGSTGYNIYDYQVVEYTEEEGDPIGIKSLAGKLRRLLPVLVKKLRTGDPVG